MAGLVGIYQFILCHLHFLLFDCEKDWFCPEADNDSQGVHMIHGYSHLFKKGKFWHKLYNVFEKVSVSCETIFF